MYNRLPEELIEEVRISNDIVDVISEYVKLEKKGKDHFGLCPFHKEKTPSFSVAAAKQIYYCFGCGKGGNVIHFIMNAENLDYIESVRLLADRAKIQLPEGESEEEKEAAQQKQEIIRINTEAARYFHSNLQVMQHENAARYLKNRGITEQTIRRFGLGYSGEEWDSLYKHLLEKKFNPRLIEKSGLILPNKKGGFYDRFRARIMFPIFDLRGNVIGFGGRVLDSSMPKYMNSPETSVYSKGRNLYALNLAKNSAQKRILIVEGYMDVISLHQNGIINTVASLGTALTESQGRILKKYAEEIIISYDADVAGQAATLRGLDLLDDIGCSVKVLQIPQGKDPDEFIRKNGAESFKKLVDTSISLFEYKVKALKKQTDDDSTQGRIGFLNKIADLLVKVDNNMEREMYIKKLAKEYEISEEAMYSEVLRRSRPKTSFRSVVVGGTSPSANRKPADKADTKIVHNERILLSLLCIDNSVYRLVKDKLGATDFSPGENQKAAQFILDRLEARKGVVPAELLNIVGNDVSSNYTKIIQEECNFEDNNRAVLDIIKGMELFHLEKRKTEIIELLNHNNDKIEGDVERLNRELSTIILEIKKKKQS
jgi:DNA primase